MIFLILMILEFYDNQIMSIVLDTRTESTVKSVQYNGHQDPGGYICLIDLKAFQIMLLSKT